MGEDVRHQIQDPAHLGHRRRGRAGVLHQVRAARRACPDAWLHRRPPPNLEAESSGLLDRLMNVFLDETRCVGRRQGGTAC